MGVEVTNSINDEMKIASLIAYITRCNNGTSLDFESKPN